jgi:hypothetical protein
LEKKDLHQSPKPLSSALHHWVISTIFMQILTMYILGIHHCEHICTYVSTFMEMKFEVWTYWYCRATNGTELNNVLCLALHKIKVDHSPQEKVRQDEIVTVLKSWVGRVEYWLSIIGNPVSSNLEFRNFVQSIIICIFVTESRLSKLVSIWSSSMSFILERCCNRGACKTLHLSRKWSRFSTSSSHSSQTGNMPSWKQ